MVRSMMNLTTLPLSFWDYALESATRILNMVPTKKVDKTPYELWYGKVPNLSYLKVWGCEALVKRDTPDKLEQRSVKCIFIGYPKETMGYYFYFPPENKIVVARYAEFFEKRLISQEISGRAVDLEEIQEEEDTTPSEITSNIPQEVEGFEPPQEEVIPIRRSERTHRAPNRLCLNVEVEEHSLGDLNEPTSYKAAMLDSEYRGGEYISQEFKDYLKANGIVQQLTPPYTPQHNGVSERRNRTLLDMVRSMMNLTTLPLSFWDYALESATRILNMVPTKKVDKTPYELWYGKVPNLSYLKVWGCEALVKRDTPDKLEQRSVKCIFIGYPKETMGYYFYFPPENKIVVARYAEFFEKRLISQEISGRAVDLEEIQEEEDTTPSEITSNIPQEVEGFEPPQPPQEEVIPIRRSERTHRAPNRLCLNVEVEEHSLGDLNEPTSYKAAMLDSESNKWIDAMNAEIQSMMDNMVWVLVDLPPGCKTVGSKWLFKKKTDMDGIVHTYKACLVAKGYTQLYGVDYEETFSPVADIRAIRILISIAAKVCKLQRSIYGLKQASRSWNKRFDEEIKRFGFAQNLDEPCVYQKASGSNVTFLILYVDDIIIMGAVDWKSSKQSTTAMSATESEYIAASEAAMEAVWIRKFISGLGIVPTINEPLNMYYDNSAAVHYANEPGMAIPVQNINHSAFRSMFEKEKLSGNNFNDWFARLKVQLQYDAHTEIACLMLGSMTPELHRQFELHYLYDMVQELRSMFEKQAGVENQEISGRAVDLEDIQKEEDTTPSEITSNIPQEVEGFELPQRK
ncbi:retrotransposon protein, putative, ty1-copia subclass [Tanacetum coccineum]